MTVSSTISRCAYAGNGSTKGFAVPFPFIVEGDVQAVLCRADGSERVLAAGTEYSLSGAGDAHGGILTMSIAPLAGEILVVRRNPPIVQEVDYMENGPFSAETHERALDRLTMICQSLNERLDRTVSLKVSSAVSGVVMPDPDSGRGICWGAEGVLVNGPTATEIAEAHEHAALAQTSRAIAEEARDQAVEAASSIVLPPLQNMSGGEMLRITPDATGYEARTPDQVCTDITAGSVVVSNAWEQAQRYASAALAINAGVVDWDMEANPFATLTLTENVTALNLTNFKAGGSYLLTVLQDGTGGWSLAFPAAGIRWPGRTAMVVTGTAGAEDIVEFSGLDYAGTVKLRATCRQDFGEVA